MSVASLISTLPSQFASAAFCCWGVKADIFAMHFCIVVASLMSIFPSPFEAPTLFSPATAAAPADAVPAVTTEPTINADNSRAVSFRAILFIKFSLVILFSISYHFARYNARKINIAFQFPPRQICAHKNISNSNNIRAMILLIYSLRRFGYEGYRYCSENRRFGQGCHP